MNKSDLRAEYIEKQKALSPEQRADLSRRVATRFFNKFDLGRVHVLHCFISMERLNEIDTSSIFDRIWTVHPQIVTVVPRIDPEAGEIDHLVFTPETELVRNAWHIHEPVHNQFVPPETVDMVLVPLIAYDRAGHRVGHGKGYYDRLLSRCRPGAAKVGLSYFPPVDRIDDVGGPDVPLTACVTPNTVYTFPNAG